MRVGVIGPTWPDAFAAQIMAGLSALGHDPVPLGSSYSLGGWYTSRAASIIRGALPALDERAQRRIARSALDHDCAVVISVEQRLMPDVVRQLRRDGAKVALWFPDSLVNLGRQLVLLAPYDALFFKDPYLVRRLRVMLGLPVFYLPEACVSRSSPALGTPGTDRHLVIAGNMYPSRIRLLERLLAAGIPLRLYGPGFPRWAGRTPLRDVHAGRCVFGEGKAEVFRSAVAVLNNLHPGEIEGVNARLFEAAGVGAAIVTEYRPALTGLFAVGDEVLAFSDFDELVGQATRLLCDDGLSAKLGDAAARRAQESHTYEKRLTALLEKLS
jgi:spore maturation protein CgeB